MIRAAKQFLRAPKVIVGELAALALLCALGAALPQAGVASGAELAHFRQGGPVWTGLLNFLALDHVFRSPLFLAATALALASLLIVVVEQIKRVRRQWSVQLTEAHFRAAPFHAEFERSVEPASRRLPGLAGGTPTLLCWSERRFGLLGSPLFHVGLLLVIAAGALRALFGASAVVDLLEGETLPATARAWSAQFPGLLAQPFHLATPVTLHAVQAAHYRDGDLRELRIELAVPTGRGTNLAGIAVNQDLKLPGGRLFLGSDFGPAALVEWKKGDAPPEREAALLREQARGAFEGALAGPEGATAYLRARVGADGARPAAVEVRVMKDGALRFAGELTAGQAVALPGGETFAVHGTPFWARLRGDRDAALGMVYAGFALVLAGAVLIFTVVKLDFCVVVTPLGERERVFVALKPQRFAPLFEERFQKLVRELSRTGILPVSNFSADARERLEACPTAKRALLPQLAALPLLLLFAFAFTGCQRNATEQARRLVVRYNQIVSEAYRRGDVRLIDPVVGPNEGRKLTGLIGVRLDAGMTLDSQLVSLEVTGVEQSGGTMRVQTKERWKYRDRKIGTGEQVGEASLDSYEMLYLFKRIEKQWLVDEIRFAAEPQVGRKKLPFPDGRVTMSHGFATSAPQQEGKQ